MKKNKIAYFSLFILMLLVFAGCSKVRKVTDAITQPSAREIYKRDFKNQPEIFAAWEAGYILALQDSLEIQLPYGEKGRFNRLDDAAFSYNFTVERGKILDVSVQKDSLYQKVFIDLFEWDGTDYKLAESAKIDVSDLQYAVKNSGKYKLIIQPEITATTPYFITINQKPLYGFPVAGKGNAAIQSFWGNIRDGGKRNHEGIDIFAAKGTPVIAVTEGRINYVGERGLGGKQVWLRSSQGNNSLYYAHLDSIAVTSGKKVKTGDTLGFVGNTGNAKFTPPHLHFGIYQGYGGAIDPLPFVYITPTISEKGYSKSFSNFLLKVTSGKATLRKGPDVNYSKLGELKVNDIVILLGENNNWLHIKTSENQKAFLHKSLVKEIK